MRFAVFACLALLVACASAPAREPLPPNADCLDREQWSYNACLDDARRYPGFWGAFFAGFGGRGYEVDSRRREMIETCRFNYSTGMDRCAIRQNTEKARVAEPLADSCTDFCGYVCSRGSDCNRELVPDPLLCARTCSRRLDDQRIAGDWCAARKERARTEECRVVADWADQFGTEPGAAEAHSN